MKQFEIERTAELIENAEKIKKLTKKEVAEYCSEKMKDWAGKQSDLCIGIDNDGDLNYTFPGCGTKIRVTIIPKGYQCEEYGSDAPEDVDDIDDEIFEELIEKGIDIDELYYNFITDNDDHWITPFYEPIAEIGIKGEKIIGTLEEDGYILFQFHIDSFFLNYEPEEGVVYDGDQIIDDDAIRRFIIDNCPDEEKPRKKEINFRCYNALVKFLKDKFLYFRSFSGFENQEEFFVFSKNPSEEYVKENYLKKDKLSDFTYLKLMDCIFKDPGNGFDGLEVYKEETGLANCCSVQYVAEDTEEL